jgi:murein DD-endopeptidase MepM/ murein hydrolase activator NlpD
MGPKFCLFHLQINDFRRISIRMACFRIAPLFLVIFAALSASADQARLSTLIHTFAKFPSKGLDQVPCLPTPNEKITQEGYLGFAARSRTNDDYGMPGWTREQGLRFHKGLDILPVRYEKQASTVTISYYDPRKRKSFSRKEPILIPKDEIYAVLDGTVIVANNSEARSGYGRYLMLEHEFADGSPFITMYAHLDRLEVKQGEKVARGDVIGWMGNTSSNSGGRNYLRAIPHCHFEVGRIINPKFTRTRVAQGLYPKVLGGNADPRNIQPYNPLEFLVHFKAVPRSQILMAQSEATVAPVSAITTKPTPVSTSAAR